MLLKMIVSTKKWHKCKKVNNFYMKNVVYILFQINSHLMLDSEKNLLLLPQE